MGMGTRKILKSEIINSTNSQTAVTTNNDIFRNLSGNLEGFIGESELQGKGWASAKELADVYKTITQTFEMVSEQLSNANQKVLSSQGILVDDQIDEQALNNQVMQNKATMTQLSYANSIWNSANPGKPNQNSYNNLQHSIKNENNTLEGRLDSLNKFDSITKSVYDDLEHTLSSLAHLISQVSNSSKTYDSKTGLFTTKNVDMKMVKTLTKQWKEYQKEQKNQPSESDLIKYFIKMGINPVTAGTWAKLWSANPSELLENLLGNERLLNDMLYGNNTKITNGFLLIFTKLEKWDKIPKDISEKIWNSEVVVNWLSRQSPIIQYTVLKRLEVMKNKGWNVASIFAQADEILSKNGVAKLAQFMVKFSDKIKPFEKLFKVAGPATVALVISVTAIDEYSNPTGPAHNDFPKAVFGALAIYIIEGGVLEGAELGSLIGKQYGAVFLGALGLLNTLAQTMTNPFTGKKFLDHDEMVAFAYKYYDDVIKGKSSPESIEDTQKQVNEFGNLGTQS